MYTNAPNMALANTIGFNFIGFRGEPREFDCMIENLRRRAFPALNDDTIVHIFSFWSPMEQIKLLVASRWAPVRAPYA